VALQVPQTVFWAVGGTVWKCEIGLFATLVRFGTLFGAFRGIDVTVSAGWGVTGAPFVLGVNFVPIVIIVLLLRSVGPRAHVTSQSLREDGAGPTDVPRIVPGE
jgi:hypothetical protein